MALVLSKRAEFSVFSAMQVYKEKVAIYRPGRGLSPNTRSASTLNLNFSAFRTMRNVCFLNHPVYGYLIKQPKQTKTTRDSKL